MSMEYYAQVVAPIINASATLVLVIATGAYVWLTKRVVDESIHQNRPYVFLRLDESGSRCDLKLVNTGNRVACDIRIEIVRDASISVNIFSHNAPTTETHSLISDLSISHDGVPTLPPEGDMTVGFIELRKAELTPQKLEYILGYHDGIGREYQENLILHYWW